MRCRFFITPQARRFGTYHQEIQQADTHPETAPQDVNDRNQDISSRKSVKTGDELTESAPERNEREEDGWRVLVSPPTGYV